MNEAAGAAEGAQDHATPRTELPRQVLAAVAEIASYARQAHNVEALAAALGDAVPHEALARAILALPSDEHRLELNAHLIGQLVQRYIRPYTFQQYFKVWQEYGFHVSPVHFYYPIPDTRTLSEDIWNRSSALVGVEMNEPHQLHLLRKVFPRYQSEYNEFAHSPTPVPHEFYLNNNLFDGTDALALYCMLRYIQPRRVVEVGSGFSSLLAARALARNGTGELVCIEPYPNDVLRAGFAGLTQLIPDAVETVDQAVFDQLDQGDVLFIDSSHVVRIDSDVNVLYLEILPRLRPGVIVHVHDIFFPREYPREWVVDECRFWTEQYLLQAFLTFNSEFEVLLSNSYLAERHMADLRAVFPRSPWWGGASLWMRRRPRTTTG